jgi:catechol-2,3-dioxygenase
MHIDHINISAPMVLLQELRDFYCQVLELNDGNRPNFSTAGFWLCSGSKAIIHLSESSDREATDQQGFFDHFAIRTQNLAKVTDKLDAIGVPYRKVHLADIGLHQVFFTDPAGTGVEVNSTQNTP